MAGKLRNKRRKGATDARPERGLPRRKTKGGDKVRCALGAVGDTLDALVKNRRNRSKERNASED